MQLQIQSKNFEADETLLKITTENFRKLEKLYDRIEKCTVLLKKEKNDRKKSCAVEVRISVPKGDLFASEKTESFDRSIQFVMDDLKKQLIKHKDKLNSASEHVEVPTIEN